MAEKRSLNEVPRGIRIVALVVLGVLAIYGSWQFDSLGEETRRLLLVALSATALAAFVVEYLQNATGPATLKVLVSMGTVAATCTAYFGEFPGSGVGFHEWFVMSLVLAAGLAVGLTIALYEYWFTRLFPARPPTKGNSPGPPSPGS